MHCLSCEDILQDEIGRLPGVINVKGDFKKNSILVEFDPLLCSRADVERAVRKAGYSIGEAGNRKAIGLALIFTAIILLGIYSGGIDMESMLQRQVSYFMLFVIGMLTSLHCIGMCGGIQLSQTIIKDHAAGSTAWRSAILYNLGRLASYTLLGGFVGAIGTAISFTLSFKAGVTVFAGVFMVIMGMNLIGFKVPLPFPAKLLGSLSKHVKARGSFSIGLLNGLLPCGPLQTMQIYALGAGSALSGASAMFFFGLGTIPLMLPLGMSTGWISRNYTGRLLTFSGMLVMILGIVMASRGMVLAGINVPMMTGPSTFAPSQATAVKAEIKDGIQVVRMAANAKGYVPNTIIVQKNIPVKWVVDGQQITSCNNEIIVPSLHIQKKLRSGENIIEFTPGNSDIRFSCWMGMIQGLIKVVDDINSVDLANIEALPSSGDCCSGGSCGMGGGKPSIYGDDISKVPTERPDQKSCCRR